MVRREFLWRTCLFSPLVLTDPLFFNSQPTSGHSSYHDSPAASGATSPYHDDSPRSSFPQSPMAEHTPLSPAYGAQPGQIFNASHPSYR